MNRHYQALGMHTKVVRSPYQDRADIVIVGNGIVGLTAALEARSIAPEKHIVIITEQSHPTIHTLALKQFAIGKLTQELEFASEPKIDRRISLEFWGGYYFMIPIARPLSGGEGAVLCILALGQLSLGAYIDAFESCFTESCPMSEAVAVSYGIAASHLALLAHRVDRGNEVITTSFSFAEIANSNLPVGATPIFAVFDQDIYTLDLALAVLNCKYIDTYRSFDKCAARRAERPAADAHLQAAKKAVENKSSLPVHLTLKEDLSTIVTEVQALCA